MVSTQRTQGTLIVAFFHAECEPTRLEYSVVKPAMSQNQLVCHTVLGFYLTCIDIFSLC